VLACIGRGQDIHFSQFYASPFLVNPAFSGHSGCRLFVGGNYRSQGKSITVPYVTQSVFIDGRISPRFIGNGWFGIGGCAYNDKAGDGELRTTGALIHLAYSLSFDPSQTFVVSVGFSGGYTSKSVDFDKLVFENQWTGTGFDPTMFSGEPTGLRSTNYLDFNAGILFSYNNMPELELFLGTSIYHINNPQISFYDANYQLDWRFVIHGGARSEIVENVELEAGFMFATQSGIVEILEGYREILLGASLLYGFNDATLYSGLWLRVSGDIIPVVGMEYRGWRLLFSYDVNVSSLRAASNYSGGFEFSLAKKLFCDESTRTGKFSPCKNFEYR